MAPQSSICKIRNQPTFAIQDLTMKSGLAKEGMAFLVKHFSLPLT